MVEICIFSQYSFPSHRHIGIPLGVYVDRSGICCQITGQSQVKLPFINSATAFEYIDRVRAFKINFCSEMCLICFFEKILVFFFYISLK